MAKFDRTLQEQFLNLIRDGNFFSIAAGACGVNRSTVWRLAKKDGSFAARLKRVKHQRIAILINELKREKSWQIRCWLLERLVRRRFRLPTGTEKDLLDRVERLEKLLLEKERLVTNHETKNIGAS